MDNDLALQKRFGEQVLKAMRIKAGLTQEALSEKINVSAASIHKWERGDSSPNVTQVLKWIAACGMDERPFTDRFRNPDMFGDGYDPEMLMRIIVHIPEDEQRQILALLHSPYRRAWLQLLFCHAELPLRARIPSASAVANFHDLAEIKGTLVPVEGAEPDMDYLKSCLEAGLNAFSSGETSYLPPDKEKVTT